MIGVELLEWISSALIVGALIFALVFGYKGVKNRHGKK